MSIFAAIVAVIKAIPIVSDWVAQLIAVYINQMQEETKRSLIDAANASVYAKTDEDRLAAIDKWYKALTRKRYE